MPADALSCFPIQPDHGRAEEELPAEFLRRPMPFVLRAGRDRRITRAVLDIVFAPQPDELDLSLHPPSSDCGSMVIRSLFPLPPRMTISPRSKSRSQTRNWQHSEIRIPVP